MNEVKERSENVRATTDRVQNLRAAVCDGDALSSGCSACNES